MNKLILVFVLLIIFACSKDPIVGDFNDFSEIPTNLHCLPYPDSGKILLFWTGVDDASGYIVNRTDDPTLAEEEREEFVIHENETYYDDTTAVIGRRYYYTVKAYFGSEINVSAPTEEIDAILLPKEKDEDTIVQDTGIVDTSDSTGTIDTTVTDTSFVDTSITDSSGTADTTDIDTGMVDTSTTTDSSDTVDTTVVDTGIVDTSVVDTSTVDTSDVDTSTIDTSGVDTTVVDSGVVDTGSVDTSVVDTAVNDTVVLPDYIILSATDGSREDGVALTWDECDSGVQYVIFANGPEDDSYIKVAENLDSPEYIHTGVVPGEYTYKVFAYTPYGDSIYSVDKGYRAITPKEFFLEVNKVYHTSQSKISLLNSESLGEESAGGDIHGTVTYTAKLGWGNVKADLTYDNYKDTYLVLNGKQHTNIESLTKRNGTVTDTVFISGIYSGFVDHHINVENSNPASGFYTVGVEGGDTADVQFEEVKGEVLK